VVWEIDVAMGEIKSRDLADISFGENSMVKIVVENNIVNLSGAPIDGPMMGPSLWTVPVDEVIKPIDEFALLTGLSEMNHFLKVQCNGPAGAHVKITFSGLE
jgi:hypothetical protein